jgi:hypothetical protein
MTDVLQSLRLRDIRRRIDQAPEVVYRHRAFGWEYVPIHPFGDELDDLRRLGIKPEECWGVDAWWGVNGDATLLETSVVSVTRRRPGLYARKTEHDEGWVYLQAVFELPFVTRQAFEAVMTQFVALGFPEAELFKLRPEQGTVRLSGV